MIVILCMPRESGQTKGEKEIVVDWKTSPISSLSSIRALTINIPLLSSFSQLFRLFHSAMISERAALNFPHFILRHFTTHLSEYETLVHRGREPYSRCVTIKKVKKKIIK